MNQFHIKCPTCGHPFAAEHYNAAAEYIPCSMCAGKLRVYAFPALYRRAKQVAAALAARLDDAACYYHADKKAEQVCDACGRFLCGFCELPFGEETLCAPCLEQRRKEPGRHALKPRQMRYDKLAISLAVLPLLYFPLTVLTAPATLFVVLRYWKKDLEFSPGRKSRMVLAFVIGLLEIIGWIFVGMALIGGIASGR